MKLDVYVHFVDRPAETSKLDAILALLGKLHTQGRIFMATLDDLVKAVEEETTLVDGVVTLVNQLREELVKQGLDAAQVDLVLASVLANKQKIADALVANTPVVPA